MSIKSSSLIVKLCTVIGYLYIAQGFLVSCVIINHQQYKKSSFDILSQYVMISLWGYCCIFFCNLVIQSIAGSAGLGTVELHELLIVHAFPLNRPEVTIHIGLHIAAVTICAAP